MSDEKSVRVNVNTGWGWMLLLVMMLADENCGGGFHWKYDGQPHSLVWIDTPKAK